MHIFMKITWKGLRNKVKIADKPFDELTFDDIKLEDYESHPVIKFEVAV